MLGVNGVIAMQHAVHHSESRQDSASQQEVIVATEKMRNRSLARLNPVQSMEDGLPGETGQAAQ